jgi:hypothetical protein
MSADPTSSPPDALPILPALGTPAAVGPPLKHRRKRPFLTRLLTGRRYDDELIVYRHSNLFYWWPVWLLGYVFAVVSYFGDMHMAIVPAKTEAVTRKVDAGGNGELEERDLLLLPKDKRLPTRTEPDGEVTVRQPTIYIAPHRTIGTVYLFVLLVVIVLTNISMRGLWSLLVVITLVLLTIILYLMPDVWRAIFRNVGQLSIYINMGGYFLISTVLFILWAANFFFLDRMTYMVFTPGQVRVRLEIGGGETVYDASGLTVQKQRSDLFRHWCLGLGSGDLIISPPTLPHSIEMPNVLRVGRVVQEIDQMIKERVVVARDDDR